MPAISLRRPAGRAWFFFCAMMTACPTLAGDKPTTPQGAADIQAFFDLFLPTTPAGSPPFVTVKPDGEAYAVSADFASMNSLFKAAGVDASYEPAPIVLKLFEQDDGKWRIVQDMFPRIVSHVKDGTSVSQIDAFRQTIVVDPALAWWLSCNASANKGSVTVKAPRLDQTFDFGRLKGDCATTVNADGSVSTTAKEEIDDIAFKVSSTDRDGKAVSSSGRMDRAAFNFGLDGLKSRKLFDLAALLSAHSGDLAKHEAEFKGLLKELAAPGLKFAEGSEASKLMVSSPLGAIALSGLKLAVAVANAGPQSAIETRLAAQGLSLPVGLAPPGAADLTPSAIDLTATLKGIDIAAGANEAIDRMRLGGEGPAISDEDSAKVAQAFLSGGPLRVELSSSHVVAPAIDADLQGKLDYIVGKPSGELTIRMRGFDKTMAAVKALGPDIAAKSLPALAMAKGLAKSEADGSLTWAVELGQDRSLKVNGIPLGKAPE